jgi:hypothetical protein
MEMNFLGRGAMDTGFRFSQTGENSACPGFDTVGESASPDNFENTGETAMFVRFLMMFMGRMIMVMNVMVIMGMFMPGMRIIMSIVVVRVLMMILMMFVPAVMMALIMIPAGIHVQMHRGDTPAYYYLLPQFITLNRELREFPPQVIERHSGVDKRAESHIPGNSRYTIKISNFHGFPFPTLLMRLAAYPAPKPLSIFTTVTPEAQELSMVRSAERPWKEAP